jgi:glycosyltransferase involved in cell wall biosynthesis
MKIIHVISSLDPAGGGPPQVIIRLAAAQANLGHELHLLTYGSAEAQQRVERELARVPHSKQVHVHQLPSPSLGEKLFASGARRAFAQLLPGTHFVHLHGIWESILKASADLAWRNRIPYCFRPAGVLDPWSLQQKRWKKRLALALGLRRTLQRAAFIHALNADEARLIEPLQLRTPCVILSNGVFLEEIEPLPLPGSFFSAHSELRGRRFVLFIARLHYKKGLDYLADAFAIVAPQFPDLNLVVAGPDEGAKDVFEDRIRRAGLQSRVKLLGPLYGADKFAALVDCLCYCLPSRQEGFSVAVTEALAARAPVVISDECHFPEVTEANAGFVLPLDAREFANAICKTASNPQLGREMGQAGRQLIESRYTWPRVAQIAIEAYQRAIGK